MDFEYPENAQGLYLEGETSYMGDGTCGILSNSHHWVITFLLFYPFVFTNQKSFNQ